MYNPYLSIGFHNGVFGKWVWKNRTISLQANCHWQRQVYWSVLVDKGQFNKDQCTSLTRTSILEWQLACIQTILLFRTHLPKNTTMKTYGKVLRVLSETTSVLYKPVRPLFLQVQTNFNSVKSLHFPITNHQLACTYTWYFIEFF